MSKVNKVAKDFQTLDSYPLKSLARTKTFTTNDKQKLTFLDSVKQFSKDNPNVNYFEIGEEIGKVEKGNFKGKFEGLIDFINRPQDINGLKKMLKGLKDQSTYRKIV